MEIPCIQVNMNKAKAASTVLTELLIKADYIAFLSEPYTAFGKVVSMPKGYKVLHAKPNVGQVVRAALIIPLILDAIFLEQLSSVDCAVAMVKHDGRSIILASMYLDGNIPIPEQDFMDKVMEYCESIDGGIVLCMDSNAHSELFSDVESDVRGDDLEDFILRHSLLVVNTGNVPTFESSRANSIIDVTLVRGATVSNWFVSQEYNASDHNSIFFTLITDVSEPVEFRPWHCAKWEVFKHEMDGGYEIPEMMTTKKLEKMVGYMYSRLDTALDLACPVVLKQPKLKGNVWMTPYLRKLHRKVQTLYKRKIRTNVPTDISAYLAAHSKFRRLCRKERGKSWRKFVSDTKDEHNMSILAKIAQHKEKNSLNLLSKADGSVTNPGIETIKRVAEVHFPAADEIQDSGRPTFCGSVPVSSAIISDKYNEYVSVDLVRLSLKKFKPFKAPGPDGIKPVVFRHLPISFLVFLTFIYKACLHFHYTPYLWKLTRVIWLPKPGKECYLDPKSFRPISLSNFLLKGLERLITWRMDFHLQYYPIHERQHGFMKGRSTEGALSNTVNYIESMLFRGKSCVGVFLDIKSAYDSMDIEQIRNSLFLHGGDDDLVGWYYEYLKNRILKIKLHTEEITFRTAVGFPQGGVASAKFWVIAFNPAIEIINSCFIEGNGYADDCAAVFGGPDMPTIGRRLQRMLDRLVVWGESCNLRFNPTKSVAMIFSRGNKPLSCPLHLGGVPLNFVSSVRYLGITLDSRLKWNLHVADRILRAKRFLMKMAAIAKDVWGPKPHLMRWVYRCVVRPMVLYGSVVWAHEAKRYADKLRQVNRLALCTLTKFPRSTPTRMLEIVADVFPLHIYLVKEAVCAFIRLLPMMRYNWAGFNNNVNFSTSHRKYWFDMIDDLELNGYDQLDTCFELNHSFSFVVRTDSFQDPSFFCSLPQVEWLVFTDGSKNNHGVGSAYRIIRDGSVVFEGSARISDHSSVFQAELYAINLAVTVLLLIPDAVNIRFHVDSQAALLALCAPTVESTSVWSVVKKLNKMVGTIEFVWVKAHSGILHNEAVDTAAKDACTLNTIDAQLVSRIYIRNQVLDKLREMWDRSWAAYGEARQSKQFYSGQNKIRAKELCHLSRYQLGRIIRVTSGHNQLGYHQHVIYRNLSPLCRYCNAPRETFAHWVDDCPAFARERQDIFAGQRVLYNDNWEVSQVLEFTKIHRVKMALSHYEPVNDPAVSDIDSGSNAPDSDSTFVFSDSDAESEVSMVSE